MCACAYYLSLKPPAAQEDKMPAEIIQKDTVLLIAEEQTVPPTTPKSNKLSNQKLLSLVEVPNLLTLSKRDAVQKDVDSFANIKTDIELGNFLRAIQRTKRLMVLDTLHDRSNKQLLGTLYLKNGDFSSAIATYQGIEANFREEIEWNLLLAYQMMGNDFIKEKIQLISTIKNDKGHPAYWLYQKNKHLF